VISLAGNALFLTGLYMAKQKRFGSGEDGFTEILELTDSQRGAARAARAQAFDTLKAMADRNRPHYDRFWAEMAKPSPSPDLLDRELWSAMLGRFEAQRQIADQTGVFLKTLAPDQRDKAVELIRARDGFMPGLLMWEWSHKPFRRPPGPPPGETPPPAIPIPPRPHP
jgi:hypothetical protein